MIKPWRKEQILEDAQEFKAQYLWFDKETAEVWADLNRMYTNEERDYFTHCLGF